MNSTSLSSNWRKALKADLTPTTQMRTATSSNPPHLIDYSMDKCDELLARLDALQALADAEVPGTEDALFASVMDVFQEACLMVGEEMKEIFND